MRMDWSSQEKTRDRNTAEVKEGRNKCGSEVSFEAPKLKRTPPT